MKNIHILGCRIDNISMKELIKEISIFVLSKKPHQICTVNPEYLMAAQQDEELRFIINHTSLNTPDGGGLIFASRYKGHPLKEKITGVDITKKIFYLAAKHGWKIFLLGGEDNVAQKTADIMKKKYPKIKIAGIFEGRPVIRPISKKTFLKGYKISKTIDLKYSKMHPKSNMDIIQKIIATKPDILLVAYGCPKQDKFIARYTQYLQVPVMIGVGGTFDYISKKVPYAPLWIRQLHLEWLYRLFTQPKRFHRIITAVFRFPWAVITHKNRL